MKHVCRYTPSMSRRQILVDAHSEDYPNSDRIFYNKRLDSFNCSNFLDVDWISSSGNSCEDEQYERWLILTHQYHHMLLSFIPLFDIWHSVLQVYAHRLSCCWSIIIWECGEGNEWFWIVSACQGKCYF